MEEGEKFAELIHKLCLPRKMPAGLCAKVSQDLLCLVRNTGIWGFELCRYPPLGKMCCPVKPKAGACCHIWIRRPWGSQPRINLEEMNLLKTQILPFLISWKWSPNRVSPLQASLSLVCAPDDNIPIFAQISHIEWPQFTIRAGESGT